MDLSWLSEKLSAPELESHQIGPVALSRSLRAARRASCSPLWHSMPQLPPQRARQVTLPIAMRRNVMMRVSWNRRCRSVLPAYC